MKGKIETVLGPIDPDILGKTMIHEHLRHDLKKGVLQAPLPESLMHLQNLDFNLETLGWIRQYPYSYDSNLKFTEDELVYAVIEELSNFKKFGGGTIVENSSIGLRSYAHMGAMRYLSTTTGVNIICGTGFYVAESQSTGTLKQEYSELYSLMLNELTKRVDGTDIKCGFIGEIGCSWPLHEFERKVLQASAEIQAELGCPVIVHPGRNKNAPEEIVQIYQEAGGNISQLVMSHLDRTLDDNPDLAEFASLGSYCAMDLFGVEVSHYQLSGDVFMPSDAQRIARLQYLIDQGFEDKLVIGHDIHTKHRLTKFGGHGFSHILANVVPMMERRGMNEELIQKILVDNPKQVLTFQK